MKMDFSNAHLTIVVAPIDLRAGFLRLATIAECLLGIPVTKGRHLVAFEQLLVKVKANNSSVQLTAAEFESFLDGEPIENYHLFGR